MEDLKNIIESLLFVAQEPLTVDRFKKILDQAETKEMREALEDIGTEFEKEAFTCTGSPADIRFGHAPSMRSGSSACCNPSRFGSARRPWKHWRPLPINSPSSAVILSMFAVWIAGVSLKCCWSEDSSGSWAARKFRDVR